MKNTTTKKVTTDPTKPIIKKSFLALVEYLESKNLDKDILKNVYRMSATKNAVRTVIRDKNNKVFAIHCWHHKQFELVSETEYGVKATSSSGLNQMCKLGVRQWTKLQVEKRKIQLAVLKDVEAGKVINTDITKEVDKRILKLLNEKAEKPKGYTLEQIEKMLSEK